MSMFWTRSSPRSCSRLPKRVERSQIEPPRPIAAATMNCSGDEAPASAAKPATASAIAMTSR